MGASPRSAGSPSLSGAAAKRHKPPRPRRQRQQGHWFRERRSRRRRRRRRRRFCPCAPTKSVRVPPAVRKMSPETSAPRPPTALAFRVPPLAPKTSSAYSPLTSTGKLCTPPVNRNVAASASATQASIARAETPASNIALDLIMRSPHGRLPLAGKLTQGRLTADHVTVNRNNACCLREICRCGRGNSNTLSEGIGACHSRASGNPSPDRPYWTPAFAGVTSDEVV